jgi:hypothetical protein
MFVGFCMEVYLWQFTAVPWTWWVAIGTVVTFATGYLASRGVERRSKVNGIEPKNS